MDLAQCREDLADVALQVLALSLGEDREDSRHRLAGSGPLDAVPQHPLVLEDVGFDRLLEGVDVTLEGGLPEATDIGHTDQDERTSSAGSLPPECPEEMGLARPASPDDD